LINKRIEVIISSFVMSAPFWRPFLITLGAGLATSIGAAFAFFVDPNDDKKFSPFLALSAGVMVYLCFTEMLPEAVERMEDHMIGDANPEQASRAWITLVFFAVMLLCGVAEKISAVVMERRRKKENVAADAKTHRDLRVISMAMFSALAVTVHNFPEGMSTFIANANPENKFGLAMAFAIGIHNIPEGIAVALPVLKATGSRWRAFLLATMSGLAQPLAAIIGWAIIGNNVNAAVEAMIYAGVSGIMVYIAVMNLYPVALEYDVSKAGMWFIAGMGIMAASLILLKL